ncbi:hypothetical protein [Hymenobacter crusticola]|nr:hypothetical protein [Hymenobacter crusticola]
MTEPSTEAARRRAIAWATAFVYSEQRFFADWQMGFVTVEAGEFHWVLTSLEHPSDNASLLAQYVKDSHLRTLLEAFS